MKNTKPTPERGLLIAFEGLDGAGKSTQITAVKRLLEAKGRKVSTLAWGSKGLVGKQIDELLSKGAALSRHAFSALHAADLADQMEKVILPALKRGRVVLCDRYSYTEVARDEALDLDAAWTEKLFSWAPQPDLVIYLDLPVAQSFERIRYRILHAPKKRRDDADLDGTMRLALESDYQADGEPMTELARRRQLRELQTKVAASYARQAKIHSFVSVDATLPRKKVRDEIAAHVLRSLPT